MSGELSLLPPPLWGRVGEGSAPSTRPHYASSTNKRALIILLCCGLTRLAYRPMSSRAKLFRDGPSASPISASVGGRSRALDRIGPRAGAELADAAGAHDRSVPTWRRDR